MSVCHIPMNRDEVFTVMTALGDSIKESTERVMMHDYEDGVSSVEYESDIEYLAKKIRLYQIFRCEYEPEADK